MFKLGSFYLHVTGCHSGISLASVHKGFFRNFTGSLTCPNICVMLKKLSLEDQLYACGNFFASLELEQKHLFKDEPYLFGNQKLRCKQAFWMPDQARHEKAFANRMV